MKEHELRLLEERASQSLHAMRSARVEEQQQELAEAKTSLKSSQAQAKEAEAKLKELTRKEAGLRKEREVGAHTAQGPCRRLE